MKNRKTFLILGIIVFIAIIIFMSYLLLNRTNYSEGTLIQEKQINGDSFKVYEGSSLMAFGSSHKILVLYNDKGKKIDEKIFGDHSLEIDSVKDGTLFLNVPSKDWGAPGYVENWCNKNEKIGNFKISCIYAE